MTADKPFLTIAYITSREEPRFEWFVDSLFRIVPPEDLARIQILFIDHHLWAKDLVDDPAHPDGDWIELKDYQWHDTARRDALADIVDDRFDYQHIPPKPSVVQGPFRLSKNEWFAASNARNTAIAMCEADHIVFADDLAVLSPTWWPSVRESLSGFRGITCGAYKKAKKMKVIDGELVGFEEYSHGNDHRLASLAGSTDTVACQPGWLYGCSFLAPVEALLEVNGFDENADTLGFEDCLLGIRLGNTGNLSFQYAPRMLSIESEEAHHVKANIMLRRDKGVSPNDKSHALLHLARQSKYAPNYWGKEGLRGLRESVLRGGKFPIMRIPEHDFYDGEPIRGM